METGERLLEETRQWTLDLIDGLSDEVMHRPLDPIMSPLVWDLGHIAAYEDLWCVHRLGERPLLREDLAATYDAFETPRAKRADAELLDRPAALQYMSDVRERTLAVMRDTGWGEIHEMVLRHELQHTETMRQALFLGGFEQGEPEAQPRFPKEPGFTNFAAGSFEMGATADAGYSYDNERPAHEVETGQFAIAQTPVTWAAWSAFAEDGGYERKEWWTDEGWSWKQCYDITHPLGSPGHPDEPVQHVSWFEADAYARSQGCRLPTEPEWERAATSSQETLDGIGSVWEWTASEFSGYPGFRAHPYPEYSEVFFDEGYRVLRGGSWAAHRRVATRTFRNWDLPQRRQIFSGLRIARDA